MIFLGYDAYTLVGAYQRFVSNCYLHFQGGSKDGGYRFLQKFANHLKYLEGRLDVYFAGWMVGCTDGLWDF